VDDITTFVTIRGQINYDAGQTFTNGQFVQLIQAPPAGTTVTVAVPNAALSPNNIGSGVRVFTFETTANGAYEAKIPLLHPTNGITISVDPISGTYSEFLTMDEEGRPVFKRTPVLFTINSESAGSVSPRNTVVKNILYTENVLNNDGSIGLVFNSRFTLQGRAGRAEARDTIHNTVTANQNAIYRLRGDLRVLVTVHYFDGYGDWVGQRTFGARTESNGVYTLSIPALERGWEVAVQVTGMPFTGTFNWFTRTLREGQTNGRASRTLQGRFDQAEDNIVFYSFIPIDGVTNELPGDHHRIRFNFTPVPSGQFYGDMDQYDNWWWNGSRTFMTL
jgi:hypothetical protein